MQHRAAFAILTLGSAGCLRDGALPWLGTCGVYPDGVYEYGQIGIGTCLSTPADLRFVERDGRTFLAVSNANAFRDFSGGSVSLIDWSSVDPTLDRNLTGDLAVGALDLPHFPGTLAEIPERGLLAVPVRFSPDDNTRASFDDLHLVDISDPLAPFAAAVAEGNATTVEVQSDPFPTAYQAESGYLYVGNRTSHTVSVIDVLASPVTEIDARGRADTAGERFYDADTSGSTAAFSTLEVTDRSVLPDEVWDLTYVAGTFQLWLPGGEGLDRYVSGGDGTFTASRYGTELDPADTDGVVGSVSDPSYYVSPSLGARMLFSDAGTLRGASPGDFLADWAFDEDPLLEGRGGAWDEILGGPFAVQDAGVTVLFYDGSYGGESAIGAAASVSGYSNFERLGLEPLFLAGGSHDAVAQRHPFVWDDPGARVWTMLYSAFDGERWTLGRATSAELDEGWAADPEPVLALQGADCAAPRVVRTPGGFTLYLALREGLGPWRAGQAHSFDGVHWDQPVALEDLPAFGEVRDGDPPAYAVSADIQDSFRIEGEHIGPTLLSVRAGDTLESGDYGFRLRLVAGEQLDLESLGRASAGGLGVSSCAADLGRCWLEATDASGSGSIGTASWDGARLLADPDLALRAGPAGGFDEDGVSSPVVFQDDDGGWVMLYAGQADGLARIGRATSADGRTWEKDDSSPVFDLGADWDSFGAWPGSVERLSDGTWRLWYTGSNGERTRIGIAQSADGRTFVQAREDGGFAFGGGSPGEWDDTSVADPWIVAAGETRHLWYMGYDGEQRRIGHARADSEGLDYERDTDDEGNPVALLAGDAGLFDYGGLRRPVAVAEQDRWVVFYQGLDAAVVRPGLALGPEPTALYKAPRSPTPGDRLTFTTTAGHGGIDPIDLDGTVDGYTTTGTGLSAFFLDSARGFLYVASKLVSYLQVLDVRDDSRTDFADANYLGVEALLPVDVASGGTGFRGLLTSTDGARLYALNDSPEGVFVMDLARIEDDAWGDVLYDTQVGWLPAARGGERDLGASTVASVGPSALALLPDGQTLLVANFNDNSLAVYDLRMGAWGQLVGEVPFLGENPYAVAVSPDGHTAVVACYEGELDETTVNSTLAVVDVDPDSDTWLEVLTWIANL